MSDRALAALGAAALGAVLLCVAWALCERFGC